MDDTGMFWATFGMTWIFVCAAVLIVIWHLRSKRKMEQMTLVHQRPSCEPGTVISRTVPAVANSGRRIRCWWPPLIVCLSPKCLRPLTQVCSAKLMRQSKLGRSQAGALPR